MDIADIEMLEAIVHHGSINKASEALHVTQPTLSKRLGRLEYKLGTPLFTRSSSGLTPTPHAEFIIRSSEPIRSGLQKVERHIELMNTLERGDLSIGVGPVIEQLYFPHALLKMTESATSRLSVSIRTETAAELEKLLVSGTIDLAVGPFDAGSADAEYEVYPIASQPLVVATRAGHPLTLKVAEEDLTQDEVLRQPLISPHMPGYMAKPFEPLFSMDSSRIVCDNYAVIREVLRESDYISIGPSAVFSDEVRSGTLTVFPLPEAITWHAACIARPESACLPVIQRVLEIFREYRLPSVEAA